jgi:hypothetical protein
LFLSFVVLLLREMNEQISIEISLGKLKPALIVTSHKSSAMSILLFLFLLNIAVAGVYFLF